MRINPSILSADFSNMTEALGSISAADMVHVDVMDSHFVPNLTFGLPVVNNWRKVSPIGFDVHLMITQPERYIEDFKNAGADILTVHLEASPHLHRTVQEIKNHGMKAGVSINPHTSVELLRDILPDLDLVLIMSVNPGFGGQKFIPSTLRKLAQVRKLIDESGHNIRLEVDGGVGVNNIREIAAAGADMFVAGSAIFNSGDYEKTIAAMRSELGQAPDPHH